MKLGARAFLALSAVTGGAIGLLFEKLLMVLLKPVLHCQLLLQQLLPIHILLLILLLYLFYHNYYLDFLLLR